MSHKIVIPFIRQETDGVKTIALIEVTTSRPLSQKTIMKTLTAIISYWIKNTETGKKLLEYNVGDFNIGDYALHETQIHDQTPHSVYTRHGIQDIKILYNGEVDGAELYDRNLVAYK